MEKILVIISSINPEEKSISTKLAKTFVELYSQDHEAEFEFLNVNDLKMSNTTLSSQNFSGFFNEEDSDKYINQLKNVDKVIVSAPMYNFNVPATLKNYLDHVLVANKTFSYKYSKKGDAIGLLDHLKVQILATQGAPYGWYLWGNHVKYLEGTFEFVGAKINKSILIDGTKLKENAELSPADFVEKHIKEIKEAVKSF
ncbi:FMN-dependent NADH-azoreductase [[Mycoplasma] gypis]|uniref:FMN dependent NADH:quinone oxidoreductase n=1 Tax=[Mycoplasma] gypis TaxID=92404 RepID=A0ABZ2RSS2_9BACT|nr:FMN-dependent NADH-azoreductase [[Mycoplasma] gypis]MBN0919134.1 FMN-dependent NADH-azoreductase [[Mycoplasma] gypis]